MALKPIIYFLGGKLHCMTCRILVPRPGRTHAPCSGSTQSPNHWTARGFSKASFYFWASQQHFMTSIITHKSIQTNPCQFNSLKDSHEVMFPIFMACPVKLAVCLTFGLSEVTGNSFNKYLVLSLCPGSILSAGDKAMSKADKSLPLQILVGKTDFQ